MNSPLFSPAVAGAPDAPGASGSGGDGGTAPRYRVFLSYSHADTAWAQWLMRRLERYRVPRRLRGRVAPIGTVGARIAPVFRDRDELPTTSDLGETIKTALREAATLVVLCSPAAAKSRWVKEEILAFKRLHGERRVFGFIIGGEPKAEGTDVDCFSPALRAELGADGELSARPAEIVAADARPQGDGRELALVRLTAGLLGVGFDELRQREQARRLQRMTWIAAGSAVGMAAMIALAVQARRASEDAQRGRDRAEDLLTFMLGDLRPQLQKVGRLELLDDVGDKALAYFDALRPRELTAGTLVRHAQALNQIGEIRLVQARFPEAARAYATAYERSAAAVELDPKNADMLFERAQAEFGIGEVHRRRGQIAEAGEWLARYRDSAVALGVLEGPKLRARREIASGHHNLAVVDFERGLLDAARAGFLAEIVAVEKLLATNSGDLKFQFRLADVSSWLGFVAERAGDLAEAAERFAAQTKRLEALVTLEPGTAHWHYKLAESQAFQGGVLAISAQRPAAGELLGRARRGMDALVAQDPKNRRWLVAAMAIRLQLAHVALAEAEGATAGPLLAEARNRLRELAAAEPTDRAFGGRHAAVWRLEAQLRHSAGRADAAEAAARAVELGQALIKEARDDDRIVGEFALACVWAGGIAAARGQPEAARPHWERAIEVLTPRLPNSNDWRLLDPAARALALLGRADESRAITERLHRLGYRPLDPWPGAAPSSSSAHPTMPAGPSKP